MIKNYKIIISVFLILSFFTGLGFCKAEKKAAKIDKYGFVKKDLEEERLKLLKRLENDKKKVELAIDNTKRLADKSRNMAFLPELYLRLAELYIEKSRIVFFIRQNQKKAKTKILDNLEANTLKNKAIESYQRILNDFPDFGERDKVRFFMAHEYRELSKTDKMIEQYRAIIKNFPKSTYVPECFLLLGDHFMGQQNLDMALRHYKKVLNYPGSSAIVIARYKLAWAHVNKGEFKKAIKLFELSVKNNEPGRDLDVDTYKRVDVKLESLVDMAYCYPEVYKKHRPEQAIKYFRDYSWSRQVYIHVLEKLGYRYLIKRKYDHAVEIYRELAKLKHDVEKKIEYAGNIFECLKETREYKSAEKDMVFIMDALRLQKYSIRIKDSEKKKNIKTFELYARDIATNLHKKAKNLKSQKYYKKSADVYKQYLDFFDGESPVYEDMMVNYAETLFASGSYVVAGKQYEKLYKLVSGGKELKKSKKNKITAKDMLGSSIISYYNALKHRDDLNYYNTEFARSGLKQNGEKFISDYPKSSRVPDIAFNICWIAFDAGKYDEAIKLFTDYLNKYPKGKTAESAVHLVIEAYHLKEDYEGLVNFGRVVSANKEIDKNLRADVAKIVENSESKLVGALTIDAMNDWEEGKASIEKLIEENRETGLGEKALKALVASGRDKGELDTIFTAGYKLVKYYPQSVYSADVLAIMIDSAGSASQFRVVSKYLEEFARRLPKHKRTPFFLNRAGKFRQTLGQYKLSTAAYLKYLTLISKNDPNRKQALFAILENSKKTEDKDTAIKVLTPSLKYLAEADRVRAYAEIAELYRLKKDYKSALRYRKYALRSSYKKLIKNNPELKRAVSEMNFNAIHGSYDEYMGIRLGESIDNAIVADKASMLDNLENGYLSIIEIGDPAGVLKSCYYAASINNEFSDFLKSAPLPNGLTKEQEKQYKEIVGKKALSYENNARKYMDTCILQSHKWQVIDKDLTGFYSSGEFKAKTFSEVKSGEMIAEDFLKDDELRDLHYSIYHEPDNEILLMSLADAYYKRGDYHQAITIAWNVADNAKDTLLKSKAFKIIGCSNLYTGNDKAARNAFKEAIKLNLRDIDSKINLAGVLIHYKHDKAAARLYASIPDDLRRIDPDGFVHPIAKELYNEYVHGLKKKN